MDRSKSVNRITDIHGRVTLPREFKTTLDIGPGDNLEIFTEDSSIILRKYGTGCVFCGEMDGLRIYKGKYICKDCCR
jgi:AbrB family transcriptional regulator, transcriptional pleiotropic regulator of transition state genes